MIDKLEVKMTVNGEVVSRLVFDPNQPAKLELPRVNFQGPLVLEIDKFKDPEQKA